MKKKYRVGVVGAGAIAQALHIPGYAAAPHCELVAIADPNKKCLKEVRSKGWHFEREYTSYKEMLANEQLDVVSVCTPNKFHAEVAIAAMKAGADLLLEKPVALSQKEVDAIAATAKRTGRRVMISFSHRFSALNVAAKKAIEAGKIGKPFMIRVRFAHRGPIPGWAKTDWFYDPELAGGGALLDMAVHAFDIAQWLVGPATSVYAQIATLRKKIPVEDNVLAVLEFPNQCLGYVEAGWTSTSGFSGIEIMGDSGAIICDYLANQTVLLTQKVTAAGIRGPKRRKVLVDKPESGLWENQMKYFTKQLRSKGDFVPGIESGIQTMRVVFGAYKSAKTGRKVIL